MNAIPNENSNPSIKRPPLDEFIRDLLRGISTELGISYADISCPARPKSNRRRRLIGRLMRRYGHPYSLAKIYTGHLK